jgi:hypothetical protein
MKKLMLLALFGLFLFGCAAPHSPTWKNWDHFKFSAWGWHNPTAETGKMSQEQGWWGEPIPYIPAK